MIFNQKVNNNHHIIVNYTRTHILQHLYSSVSIIQKLGLGDEGYH